MGNANSTRQNSNNGSCNECNCESEVPRVIAACNAAGEKGITTTLKHTVTSLVGKENSDFIMNEYISSVVDNNKNNKWVEDYNKVKETYNNRLEGFTEGQCVRCDCVKAADDIINDCKNATNKLTYGIDDLLSNIDTKGMLSPILNEVNEVNDNTEQINSDWKNIFRPSVTKTEGFFSNTRTSTGLYTFSRDALASRHETFKDTETFQTDCKNNSYISISNYITEEKNILDSLYNYYLTFIKDYDSLYLHKESFSKTIYNKLDELEKIQGKIDSYKTNLHVDNRKNLYQSNNYEFYTNIQFYILIVYYSILILYFIFSKFFSEKQYTNKFLLLILFLYLIIPIILEQLINFIYRGYIYFLEYNNLKEDTKSYEDIINKNIR